MHTTTISPVSQPSSSVGRFWGVSISSDQLLVAYCLLIFALSWGLQIGAILTSGDIESPAAEPWLIAAMFTPGLVTLLTVALFKPARVGFLWRFTKWMFPLILVAVLVPILIAFGVMALTYALGWGRSGWFTFAATGVSISGGPWILGTGGAKLALVHRQRGCYGRCLCPVQWGECCRGGARLAWVSSGRTDRSLGSGLGDHCAWRVVVALALASAVGWLQLSSASDPGQFLIVTTGTRRHIVFSGLAGLTERKFLASRHCSRRR